MSCIETPFNTTCMEEKRAADSQHLPYKINSIVYKTIVNS